MAIRLIMAFPGNMRDDTYEFLDKEDTQDLIRDIVGRVGYKFHGVVYQVLEA
jgi:hypothetical protein